MPSWLQPLLDALVEPVTRGLLHSLWQGGLVAVVLTGVLSLTHSSRAVTRYRLSCLALVLMVGLPVWTTLQSMRAERPSVTAAGIQRADPMEEGMAGEAHVAWAPSLLRWSRSGLSSAESIPSLRKSLFVLWLAGVLLLSTRHLMGWRRLRRLERLHAGSLIEWQPVADRLAALLGIRTAVRVLLSAAVEVPAVLGWLRPVILVPLGTFGGLTPQQVEGLLAHELAHVLRRDYLVNLLQVMAETLLFYHPAVWWVSGRIRRERENCCDDMAVALTGDRLSYAKALLRLEELRARPLLLAPGSAGGVLTQRIQRITGGRIMFRTSTVRPLLAGAALTLTMVFGAAGWTALASEYGSDWPDAESSSWSPAQAGAVAGATVRGQWNAKRLGGQLKLRLRTRDAHHDSSMTLRVEPTELKRAGANADFVLRRDAGSFFFQGELRAPGHEEAGSGSFSFVPDPGFAAELVRLGVSGVDDRRQFVLAASDVGLSFVRGLVDLGYSELEANQLVAVGIHKVNPDFIRALADRGLIDLSLETLLAMRIHGATPDYVDEMASLGYTDISASQLIAWRVHGVSEDFIREMAAQGYEHPGASQLVAWRVHGVSPEYLREMASLGLELSADQAVAFRVHGVSPEYLREMASLGLELSADLAVAFRVHDVGAVFVREIRALGYPDPDPSLLVAMKVHGITPGYLERLHQEGREGISLRDAVELKVWGHTP